MSHPTLQRRFSRTQLQQILEQALIYQCACPAQVTKLVIELVQLYDYQQGCLDSTSTDSDVHRRIAGSVRTMLPIAEECLAEILTLEGWNMQTLQMPARLQKELMDDLGD